MSRVTLLHWRPAEASARLASLRRAGHQADLFDVRKGGAGLRGDPPDLFVIDLNRSPSQGHAVAVMLRQRKATRRVPIVFVAGEPAKVARVRQALPDATYTSWGRIRSALRRALARPPVAPVVPGTMDAYSGTPLPRKLGIKDGAVVALLGAPAGFERGLVPLPDAVRFTRRTIRRPTVMLLFARSLSELRRRVPAAKHSLSDGGRLWMIWPKKSSGVPTDLNELVVRDVGLSSGLVDYKICAVDTVWSGLCFARRRVDGSQA